MGHEIHICRPGFEQTLRRELLSLGYTEGTAGAGEVAATPPGTGIPDDLCYASLSLLNPTAVSAQSVNALAGALCDLFGDAMRGVSLTQPWLLRWEWGANEVLKGRCRSLAREFNKRLQRRMGRVARLASSRPPADAAPRHGLVVQLRGPGQLVAATRYRCWGQRRMRLDSRSPSRSYLKVEEAFALMGVAPVPGEIVVDLGAAPGGWSFSAAARGAEVWAVDNGPLKGAADSHDRIRHRREDAFGFALPRDQTADWMLCDLIETPARVVEYILLPWLGHRRCRRFVVNLKVGRQDPIELLQRLRGDGDWGLSRRCDWLAIRHLYHDREELTCIGRLVATEERCRV